MNHLERVAFSTPTPSASSGAYRNPRFVRVGRKNIWMPGFAGMTLLTSPQGANFEDPRKRHYIASGALSFGNAHPRRSENLLTPNVTILEHLGNVPGRHFLGGDGSDRIMKPRIEGLSHTLETRDSGRAKQAQ